MITVSILLDSVEKIQSTALDGVNQSTHVMLSVA